MQSDVLASIIGFPGVGQLMQKRWVAGAAYAVVFAVALALFLMEVLGILRSFYDFALNFDTAAAPAIHLSRLFASFGAAIGSYLVNIADVVIARSRIDRQRRQSQVPPQISS